ATRFRRPSGATLAPEPVLHRPPHRTRRRLCSSRPHLAAIIPGSRRSRVGPRGSWARALASAPAECWLDELRAFGIEERADCAAVLEACAWDLGQPSKTSGPHEDPVRKALALALWMAATDLRACLSWIRSWLT